MRINLPTTNNTDPDPNLLHKYNVLYADPPWTYNQAGNNRGTAIAHYETMSLTSLINLAPAIQQVVTDDCICFMWATAPQLPDAIHLLHAWGFRYKTVAFVWVKKNKSNTSTNFWGMGSYTRANAEFCLLGISKNTKPTVQVKSHRVHQIIESPVRDHSRKPDITRQLITDLLGSDTTKLELFAREQVPGWDCFGLEV